MNSIVQVAYFVTDVRASAREMHRRFGAGPFFVAERIEFCDHDLGGRQTAK